MLTELMMARTALERSEESGASADEETPTATALRLADRLARGLSRACRRLDCMLRDERPAPAGARTRQPWDVEL